MTMRLTSGMIGLIAISVTIYLESHGHIIAAQYFIWSTLAMSAPVAVFMVTDGELAATWFWVAVFAAATLHAFLSWSIWKKLPFPNASVAIVFGFVEAIVLAIISAKIREWFTFDEAGKKR